jgi:hypothetical protein
LKDHTRPVASLANLEAIVEGFGLALDLALRLSGIDDCGGFSAESEQTSKLAI